MSNFHQIPGPRPTVLDRINYRPRAVYVKVPTYEADAIVAALGGKAELAFLRFFRDFGTFNQDSGMSVEALAKHLNVKPKHIQEVIDAGGFILTAHGTVSLAEFKSIATPDKYRQDASKLTRPIATTTKPIAKTSTERTRKHRAKKKTSVSVALGETGETICNEATVSPVQNCLVISDSCEMKRSFLKEEGKKLKIQPPTPVTAVPAMAPEPAVVVVNDLLLKAEKATEVPPEPMALAERAEEPQETPQQAQGSRQLTEAGLVYPPCVTDAAKASVRRSLLNLSVDMAQAVLDELDGASRTAKGVASPGGWIRVVADVARRGEFVPALGIAIAEQRRVPPASRYWKPEPVVVLSLEEELASIATAEERLKITVKDPDIMAVSQRILAGIRSRLIAPKAASEAPAPTTEASAPEALGGNPELAAIIADTLAGIKPRLLAPKAPEPVVPETPAPIVYDNEFSSWGQRMAAKAALSE